MFSDAPDEGRKIEFDKYFLRAVLHYPMAFCICEVVAIEKRDGCGMGDGLTFITDAPAAAAIQRKPAITVGHIGPLGQAASYEIIEIIHGSAS